MTSSSRPVVILGLILTLVVVGAALVGLLDALERETVDFRFTHIRWRDDPMSDEIRFVDIDDGALDSVGRWPWDRSTLADAIEELRVAGARTIALDILFDDPQRPDRVDHDAVLAEAIASVRCVLTARAGEPVLFHHVWSTARGREELDRLLETLSRDIQLDADEAAQQAGLTGPRHGRFRARPIEFKKAAADVALHRIAAERGEDLTYGEFIAEVAPNVGEYVDAFPERPLLVDRWDQHQSWLAIRPLLRHPPGAGTHRDKAPLPAFAREADGIGYVNLNIRQDADGELRSLPAVEPGRGGSVLQFGLAAAALHLGVAPDDLQIRNDRLVLDGVNIPLVDGRLNIAWPATETDWSGVLRHSERDRPTAGRVSIAALVSLAQQRRALARNKDRERELAGIILNRAVPEGGDLSEALIAEVDDQVEFQLASVEALVEEGETITEQERAMMAPYERWLVLRTALVEGEARIAAAAERLRDEMADKLVFVGMTATGTAADFVQTPLGTKTPGVVAHATVADMILSNRRTRPMPARVDWLTALVFGLLCTALSARLTPAPATLFVVLLLGGYTLAAGAVFGRMYVVLPLVAPLAAGGGAWMACTALGAVLFQRERQRIARRFRTRVSPQLVDYLLENPNALSVAGEPREVTTLFLDIAGFTAITEAVEVPVVIRALNSCMSEFTACVTRHGGYVNKFLGDGLMAFWSAFHEDEDQAAHACRSALECCTAMQRLNESEGFADLPPFSIRIGITTGYALVGDCGAPPQLNDYTVIGNEINLASRLESANKQFGTSILVNERTRELLAATDLRTRPIGRLIVAGQTVPVMVHELLGSEADGPIIELMTEAVEAFLARDYDGSARAWKRVAEIQPTKLASFYLDAIGDADSIVGGAVRLREK